MAGEPEQHTTITVPEIANRLGVCEETVYAMLKEREIPNIRHGHRFIISRAAFQHWEATIGQRIDDIHDKADESCAMSRERLKLLLNIEDLLNNPEN